MLLTSTRISRPTSSHQAKKDDNCNLRHPLLEFKCHLFLSLQRTKETERSGFSGEQKFRLLSTKIPRTDAFYLFPQPSNMCQRPGFQTRKQSLLHLLRTSSHRISGSNSLIAIGTCPPFLLFWSSCVREFSDIFRHVLLIPGPTSSYSLDTFLNTIFSLSLPSFSNASMCLFFSSLFFFHTSLCHNFSPQSSGRYLSSCRPLCKKQGGKTSLSLFDPDNLENETTNQQLNHYYQKATH
jgi:hypothetical protein